MYLDVLHGRDRLPFRREPGEPVPTGSAAAQALRADNGFAIDDSGAIDGVSCAAQTIRLPGGEMAAVGVVMPASRLRGSCSARCASPQNASPRWSHCTARRSRATPDHARFVAV